jgi:hypothetical protein
MPESNTLSAKELAQECGTDPKTVRKFLRDHLAADEQPGQGGRYAFTKKEAKDLVKAYKEWGAGKAAKAETKSKSKKTEEIEDLSDEELEDFEADLDEDEEPDDDDLEEIEAEIK